jgi:hypothetical protein
MATISTARFGPRKRLGTVSRTKPRFPVFAALTDIKGRPRHARRARRLARPSSSARLRVAPGAPLTSSRHGSIAHAQSLMTHWNDRRAKKKQIYSSDPFALATIAAAINIQNE